MEKIISIGGSVSTGSSPWKAILSTCKDLKELQGEVRIGESGLYSLVAKLYVNELVSEEEVLQVRSKLLQYGKSIPMPARLALAVMRRSPITPIDVKKQIDRYRLAKRGYNKTLNGFLISSSKMMDDILLLTRESRSHSASYVQNKLKNLMSEYLYALANGPDARGNKYYGAVIDQLFAPRLLFDPYYGSFLPDIFCNVKFIVVRRDPRDQFIDLITKKKKRYHEMSPDVAVKVFVDKYLPRYDNMEEKLAGSDANRIISVWFEDIVYDLTNALMRLEKFLGLTHNSFSDLPELEAISKNIELYKFGMFQEQVSFIESHMSHHLYSASRHCQ